MKRTTYILIGALIIGFLVLIGGMLVVFSTGTSTSSNVLLGGEEKMKELPSFRHIVISRPVMESDRYAVYIENLSLAVTSATDERNTFSAPSDAFEHLDVKVENDTLKIYFDYTLDKLPAGIAQRRYAKIDPGVWTLKAASKIETVTCGIEGTNLGLKHLAQDSLAVFANCEIAVDSCRIASLNVLKAYKADFRSGDIQCLYLDLDKVGNWFVDTARCRIEEEHLTGTGNSVHLQKGECRRLFWTPKNADSELSVKLSEPSVIEIAP